MSAICKRANTSPGHLYHYFASKEDLIEAIVEEDSARAEQKIATILRSMNPVRSMMEAATSLWSEDDKGYRGALNAEMMAEASRNPRIARIIRDREERLLGNLTRMLQAAQQRGQIDPDLDCATWALLLLSIFRGMILTDDANIGFDREVATTALQDLVRRALIS